MNEEVKKALVRQYVKYAGHKNVEACIASLADELEIDQQEMERAIEEEFNRMEDSEREECYACGDYAEVGCLCESCQEEEEEEDKVL